MLGLLRNVPLFRAFSDEALEELVPLVATEEHRKGDLLFREGDEGKCFYIVAKGDVAIVKEGKELARFTGGALFGEMAAYGGLRTADAVSLGDTTLYRIDNHVFKDFLLDHPQEATRFLFSGMEEMAGRLARTSDYLVTVFETGRIVGEDLDLAEMCSRILDRLLLGVREASGGMILIVNPYVDAYEVVKAVNTTLMDADDATAFVERASGETLRQPVGDGVVLCVPMKGREDVLGFILLEKPGSEPFGSQEEIIAHSVADQVGLGILKAYHSQEEQARERLEQSRWRL